MRSVRHLLRLGACAAAAFLVSTVRAEDDNSVSRVKFSDPAKPGVLKLVLPWADIQVRGTDGDEIVVRSSLGEKGHEEPRDDGLRRLDEEITFEVVEKNNVVTVGVSGDSAWTAHGAEFKIDVPRRTGLVIRTQAGGDILVEGVDGDLDISNLNGEITLRDIGSSAVVNTMNGEINATYRVAPTKPVSFSSMNGEITLRLPADTKANLRLRSHNGAILTDFPDHVLKAKSEKSAARGSRQAYHYSYGGTPQAREIARAAAEAARAGVEIAREVSREVSRAMRESEADARRAEARVKAAAPKAKAGVDVNADVKVDVAATPEAPEAPEAPESPEAALAPLPPMPPISVTGGKSVTGTLNGGGTDISLATMNGTITVRQSK